MTSRRNDFWPALAFAIAFTVAGCVAFAAAVLSVKHPEAMPPPTPPQNQSAESLVYAVSFLLILPFSLVAATRLSNRISEGPNPKAAGALAQLLLVTLFFGFIFIRVSAHLPWGDGVGTALVTCVLWFALAAALSRRALQRAPWQPFASLAQSTSLLWLAVAGLGIGVLLSLPDLGSVDLVLLLVSVPVAAAAAWGYGRLEISPVRARYGRAIDLVVCFVVFLAVVNLVIFRPEASPGNLDIAFETSVIQAHQNFFIGPANQILSGSPILVDTVSQYGVGSILALTAWFKAVPISYGTLGLLENILTGLFFISGYLVMRLAGVGRLLAIPGIAVAVVVLTWNLDFPVGALLQHGALRFGLPMAIVLVCLTGSRWPRMGGWSRFGVAALFGLSSFWALEAFAYSLVTVAALSALQVWWLDSSERRGWILRRSLELLAACVAVHAVFALLTLAFTGQLPDWGMYLTYLRAFLFEKLGEITYDFRAWSPGFAVAVVYLSSIAAIVLLLMRRPGYCREQQTRMLALVGMTAFGVALFSYFVNRSTGHVLPYVCLPALVVVVIWLQALLEQKASVPLGARRLALGTLILTAGLAISTTTGHIGLRFDQSALSHAAPGGASFRGAFERLWDGPRMTPNVDSGIEAMNRYMPGEKDSLVLTLPEQSVEILVRERRGNVLPLGNPWQDSYVAESRVDDVRAALEDVEPGDRVLLDDSSLNVLDALKAEPDIDPLDLETGIGGVAPLQVYALDWLSQRFRFEEVGGKDGFTVVSLQPRN